MTGNWKHILSIRVFSLYFHYLVLSTVYRYMAWGCFWKLPLISKRRKNTPLPLYLDFVRLYSFVTKSIKLSLQEACEKCAYKERRKRCLFILRGRVKITDCAKRNAMLSDRDRFISKKIISKNCFAGARISRPPKESAQPVIRHRCECHTRIRKHSVSLFVTSIPAW